MPMNYSTPKAGKAKAGAKQGKGKKAAMPFGMEMPMKKGKKKG